MQQPNNNNNNNNNSEQLQQPQHDAAAATADEVCNDTMKMPAVDEDARKAKQRENARLRKQKSRESQKRKGVYDAKNNLPMRRKRADEKNNYPQMHAAKLADLRNKCPKRSELPEEKRQMARDKDKKRYHARPPEKKEERNKQKRELEQKRVVALKEVLQLSKEDATKYLPSITNCTTEAFKGTEAFKTKPDLEALMATIKETHDDIRRACEKAKEPGDFGYLLDNPSRINFTPLESDKNAAVTWKIHITNEKNEFSDALKQCCTNVFVKLHNPVTDPKVVATLFTVPAILLKKDNSSRSKYSLTGLNVEYVDMLSTLPTKRARKKGYGATLMDKSMELLNADYVFLLTNADSKDYYISKLEFKEIGNDIKLKIPATWNWDEDIKSTFLYKKLKDDCQDLRDDNEYIMLFDVESIIG